MRISDWSSDVCSSDLIVLAQDAEAVVPAISRAQAEGIPVVGYDRLIEMPGVFYLTFDNKEVGRIQAREVLKVQPEGRSEERRVGKGGVSKCRSRWPPYH